MVAIGVINFILFGVVVKTRSDANDTAAGGFKYKAYQSKLLWLSVPFIFECAYRGVFPSLYNERQVFWDTPLNSIVIDRTLAAVGEVCWVTQIALVLMYIQGQLSHNGHISGSTTVNVCSVLMVVFAVVGECFSYAGTATTNAIFEVCEASCWTLLFLLGGIVGIMLFCKLKNMSRQNAFSAQNFTGILGLQAIIYCPYMIFFNIPMYYKLWKADQEAGKLYLPFWDGLYDAAVTRYPTHEWSDWKSDCFWMTFYFSFAVWSSILMIYAPKIKNICRDQDFDIHQILTA